MITLVDHRNQLACQYDPSAGSSEEALETKNTANVTSISLVTQTHCCKGLKADSAEHLLCEGRRQEYPPTDPSSITGETSPQ